VKTCEWGAGACDRYACETDGYCKTAWSSYYDCSLISKPKPTGQATHIASVTRGTVHHKITGGDKVVKTILEAAAAGIADAGVGSAVTFNGSFLARDSKVFFGKMDPKNWSGDVQAWPLDEKTARILVTRPLGGMVWSAAEKIDAGSPASRVMLTYQRAVTDAKGKTTPGKGIAFRWDELSDEQKADIKSSHKGEMGDEKEGETRLSFLRGDRADEGKGYGFRIRDSRLGDIWHSSPVHVGAPRPPRWAPRIKSKEAAKMFKAYLSFVRKNGGREPIVYVGANDGALHGFNAKTGTEVLSYFPAALYASLKDSKGGGYHKLASPEYSHRDYVDGTPSVFDAYLGDDDGSSEWRSILVGSLGGGGRGFFGLDVTDPLAFSEANADDIVLGEFSNADDDHLGYSYSKARLGKMNNGRWAVIIGNGLDDTATDESGGQAQLFIVYIDGDAPGDDGKWDLGTDYIRIATGKGSAEVGLRNGLFTPTIVDVNGDGTIDRAYAGDLQGNLWAFDLSSKSSGAWKVALGKKPLLKAAGNRPITAAPLVVRPNHRAMGRTRRDTPGLMVAFGTGRFLKDRDKVYTEPQRFYAIYDRGVPIKKAKKQLVQQPLKQSTVKTATGESRKIRLTKGKLKIPYSHSEFPKYGWYMNLPEKGERVVSEAKFARGVVYFNSIVPDISVCSSGGEGWEMAVKLVNGGNPKAGNHDVNEDEKVDGDDVAKEGGDEAPAGKRLEGRGMPTGPMLFDKRRFTATSKMEDGSDLKTTALERIDREKQGRLSWEELKPRQQ
jgi:type IV pilus assembly protein PilY1